jgi:hypothetical protein
MVCGGGGLGMCVCVCACACVCACMCVCVRACVVVCVCLSVATAVRVHARGFAHACVQVLQSAPPAAAACAAPVLAHHGDVMGRRAAPHAGAGRHGLLPQHPLQVGRRPRVPAALWAHAHGGRGVRARAGRGHRCVCRARTAWRALRGASTRVLACRPGPSASRHVGHDASHTHARTRTRTRARARAHCAPRNTLWTGASLKFTVLNPKGRVWLMVAGGGASVIYAGVADSKSGRARARAWLRPHGCWHAARTHGGMRVRTRGHALHAHAPVCRACVSRACAARRPHTGAARRADPLSLLLRLHRPTDTVGDLGYAHELGNYGEYRWGRRCESRWCVCACVCGSARAPALLPACHHAAAAGAHTSLILPQRPPPHTHKRAPAARPTLPRPTPTPRRCWSA